MKRIFVLFWVTVILLFSLSSCSKYSAEYDACIKYNGTALPEHTVMISLGSRIDGHGMFMSAGTLIGKMLGDIPKSIITDGDITLHKGKHSGYTSSIKFVGVYTTDGELTDYTKEQLSELAYGDYIICVKVEWEDESNQYGYGNDYLFVRVEKLDRAAFEEAKNG